jgi:hypothetical protein
MSRRRRRRNTNLTAVPAPAAPRGRVVCHQSGDRWTVELLLDEVQKGQMRTYTILLTRLFATVDAARRAGEQAVADWKGGTTSARDLMLTELSATYRKLRETHPRMHPATVPTTRSAWENALGTWLERGWITPEDAEHLRAHVQDTLAPESGAVQLRRFPAADSQSSESA